jgi:hypothetical protein
VGAGGKGEGGEKGGEMTETMYAHMNKIKIFKKSLCILSELMLSSIYNAPVYCC